MNKSILYAYTPFPYMFTSLEICKGLSYLLDACYDCCVSRQKMDPIAQIVKDAGVIFLKAD